MTLIVPIQRAAILDAVRTGYNAVVSLDLDSGHKPIQSEDRGVFLLGFPYKQYCVPILQTLVREDKKHSCEAKYSRYGWFSSIYPTYSNLKFMPDHTVAHRDYKIMPEGYHPQKQKGKPGFTSGKAKFLTRTHRPPKYYLIDFGISHKYETRDPPPLEQPILEGDKSVPEFRFTEDGNPPDDCDPFPTDVHYLGNMIRVDFIEARCFPDVNKTANVCYLKGNPTFDDEIPLMDVRLGVFIPGTAMNLCGRDEWCALQMLPGVLIPVNGTSAEAYSEDQCVYGEACYRGEHRAGEKFSERSAKRKVKPAKSHTPKFQMQNQMVVRYSETVSGFADV
ncbi:hypothetical protein DFH07DRAFT_935583 [Mycena maculata]|uniref:Uncharacterized protein n=1 Tax=Mycena maculata TaxID=230809 RepID=A0AAD7KBU8_9AGAR|nr:hypothetical protein DFH07DRAFT_935583 [Mycena maculata]